MEKTINVGGRLHNPVVGGALTGANEIKDDTKGKMQNVINQETDAELLRLDGAKQDKLTFDQTPTENSTNPVTSGGVYAADAALQQAIEAILLLIPSAASALNQLSDKSFVNSSIATATATFRGTYNLVTDLELTVSATHQQIATALASVISTADNNDYCFVQIPVSDQSTDIRVTERYKFDGTSWEYEYDLNNSGFTADQWGAINSGITSVLVCKLGGLPTAQELATMFAGKQNTLTFDNTPVAGSDNPVKSGGLYNAFAAINALIPEGADANNKLVAESRLVAYVTTLINALDATFDVTSADGHVTLRMTQADGVITSVQILTSDIASSSALTTLGGRVSTAEADIDDLQDAYAALTQSDVVIVEGALPSSGQQQNIIYRQLDQEHTPPQYYSDYMWNGTTWVLMATYMNGIDPRPKKGSQNLVTSGGVFDNMGALDVSELNATENPHTLATYADLSAALAAIPSDYQKGGMSIKFVQSSDNNYVQYRYLLSSLNPTHFVNIAYWQKEDEEVIVLQGIGISGVGLFTKVGDCYYNTTQNTIKKCVSYTDGTHFEDISVAPQENIIYLVDNIPYTFNGSTLTSYVKEKNEDSLKRFSQQNFFNEQNDESFKDIFPFTIPACGVFPIWEPTITGDSYTADNDMYNTEAPLTYDELLKEFYDKYIGYQKDGYTVIKNEIGRTTTENASYPIYEYDFIPKRYNKIIMLSAGMNAEELTPIFGLCFFIKNLMENHSSDDGLDYLYNNVRFKIVPIINVWGYYQQNLQYKNAEGININLNWDYNNSWATQGSTDPDSNFYKGESPFCGQETKILKKWLSDNGRMAELWVDCHSGVGVQADVSNLKTFYTFASPKSLQDEIIKCQANIISYYQGKGFSPSAASCELGTAYPKTADAFGTYGVKGIMIEQYPNAPGYGGSGATDQSLQNKDVDIANYVLMIRAYILAAIEKKVYTFTHDDIPYMLYQWKLSTFGRDNIDANFPLYTFFHEEPTWAYNRRGTELIPVIGGTDKVFIVPISDIVILECLFYNNGSPTQVYADSNGNIIYSTLSGQKGFRVTFRKPDNSGMEYFGIDKTMVEIEINGVAFNANYDFTHHAFMWDATVVLSTDRARVMSKFINVESGLYTIKLKENFEIVDLFAFNADGSSYQSLSINNNTFKVPSGKTKIRMSIKKSGNTAIHLIETEGLIEALYKMID